MLPPLVFNFTVAQFYVIARKIIKKKNKIMLVQTVFQSLFNRPGVVGAILQTPSSIINRPGVAGAVL